MFAVSEIENGTAQHSTAQQSTAEQLSAFASAFCSFL
jgi:hypothetical protein